MSRVGNNKLIMTIGLTVLLIIQLVVFFIAKGEMAFWSYIMLSLIVVLAVGAVLVTYSKVKVIKRKVEKLPDDYQKIYLNAQEAIGLSNVSKTLKEDIKNQILEIFEHAAMENRSARDVISNNLDEFLQPFLEAAGSKEDFIYYALYGTWLYSLYLIFFKLYKVVRIGLDIDNFVTEKMDVGITLSYALIAFVFFPWMMIVLKKSSQEQWTGIKKSLVILPAVVPLGLLGLLIFIDTPSMREFLDQPVPIFDSVFKFFIGLIVSVLLFVAMRLYIKRN